MWRWGLLIAICVAVAASAFFFYRPHEPLLLPATGTEAPPIPDPRADELKIYADRLKTFNPATYAKDAIRAGDYRHVVTIGESAHNHTPGIQCLAGRDKARYLGFVHGRLTDDRELDAAIVAAARDFNRALTSEAGYPDKDICFSVTKRLKTPEEARFAAEPTRRPRIVDLHTAVRAQDLEAVAKYLATEGRVNAVDEWSRTPLMWATQRKNIAIAEKLLASGAKLDIPDDSSGSALQIATETGDADFVRKFLAAARRHGTVPRRQGDALGVAVALGRIDLIKLLIEYDETPRPDDPQEWERPLNAALERECLACMETLLAECKPDAGADSAIQKLIVREFDGAHSNALLPLVRAALDGFASSRAAKQVLAIALEKNDPELVRKLLAETHDVNLLRTQELTDLIGAIKNGDERQLNAALIVAKTRRRELDGAIRANDQERIGKIVTGGTTLDQDLVFTPLMQAAVASNGTTIETLLRLGAKREAHVGPLHQEFTTAADEAYIDNGTTALYYAVKHLNFDAARTLLLRGASLDAKESPWTTGLRPMLTSVGRLWEDAPLRAQERFVDLILRHGQRQKHADQMLASAAAWERRGLIEILIARGARSCADIDYASQAIESVGGLGDLELLRRFIPLCPTWSPTAPIAQATLKEAISSPTALVQNDGARRLEVIRYLLKQGVPLPKPEYGFTALEHAVMERNTKLAELLLEHGADINEIQQYRTALDLAEDDAQMTNLLRANGARTAKELGVNTEQSFPF